MNGLLQERPAAECPARPPGLEACLLEPGVVEGRRHSLHDPDTAGCHDLASFAHKTVGTQIEAHRRLDRLRTCAICECVGFRQAQRQRLLDVEMLLPLERS